jgi:hypothetical protein
MIYIYIVYMVLSEFDCTVIKSEAVFAVTDAGRLAVPGWGGEAGNAVKEVSLRFLLRLV